MSQETRRQHSENPNALPEGTRLGEFELRQLLGVGGFGIVYLAFDHALEREVAIKEYMPASLAGRTETMHVSIRSQSDAETFELGRKSFVNEARLLAQFDHPSLLKVHRFWEANGTAYMAMPVMRGRTVRDVRLEMPQPPDEAWMRAVLDPLLGAIDTLHAKGVYHRDIAPDNIQIEPDGHPVLLDFGAARRVLSDKSQALTAILKPAYAPIEQYAEAGSVKQGPWTDIYALGATLHFLLLTRPPPPATARAVQDDASALTTRALPGCSETFLRTIDWMLAPRPADRPQSVAALREVLDGRAQPPVRHMPPPAEPVDWDRTVIIPGAGTQRTAVQPVTQRHPTANTTTHQPVWPPQDDVDATQVLPSSPLRTPTQLPQQPPTGRLPPVEREEPTMRMAPINPPRNPQPLVAAPAKSKLLPIGIGLGVVLVGVAVAFGVMRKGPASTPAPDLVASAAPLVVAAAPAPAPAASIAESQVAQVVVPASPSVPAAQGSGPGPAPATAATAAPEAIKPNLSTPAPNTGAVKPPPAVVKPPPTSPNAKGPPAPVQTAPPPPVVVAAAPPVEPVKPKAEPAPAVVSPPPVAEAPKVVPQGPEARCSGRNPLMYFVCMEKECLTLSNMEHADCKKWRINRPQQQ